MVDLDKARAWLDREKDFNTWIDYHLWSKSFETYNNKSELTYRKYIKPQIINSIDEYIYVCNRCMYLSQTVKGLNYRWYA